MFIFFFSCLKNGIKADDRTVNWKQILLKLDSLLSEVNEFKKKQITTSLAGVTEKKSVDK